MNKVDWSPVYRSLYAAKMDVSAKKPSHAQSNITILEQIVAKVKVFER